MGNKKLHQARMQSACWQLAGFPLTVIQVEERARYLGALDQEHTGQRLDLQTLVAGAVERSLDLVSRREMIWCCGLDGNRC